MKESSAELLHEFLKAEAAAAIRDGEWYSLSVDFQFSHNGEASQYKSLEVTPVGLPSPVDKASDRFGVQIERDWHDFVSTALANNRSAVKASADRPAGTAEKKYWVLKPDDEIYFYVFCKSEIASLSHDIICRSTSKDDAEKICELLNRDDEARRAPKQLEVKAGDLGAEGINKFAELIRASVKSSVAQIRDDLIAQMKTPPWMKDEVDAQEISPAMPGKTGARVGLGDDDAFVEIDGVKYSADFAKAYGMRPPADEVPDREEASAPASGAACKSDRTGPIAPLCVVQDHVINRKNDEIRALRAELESLRPIHGAVSDYFMGARHREFSKLNGGQSDLRKLAFRRMREYEKWLDENASEDCRDRC